MNSKFSNIDCGGIFNFNDFINAPEASLNVDPVANDSIYFLYNCRKRYIKHVPAFVGITDLKPWFVVTSLFAIAIYPIGARELNKTLPAGIF